MLQINIVQKIKTYTLYIYVYIYVYIYIYIYIYIDFMFNNFYFDNRAVYVIMWKNIVQQGRQQMSLWRMRITCWIRKATNKHTWNV